MTPFSRANVSIGSAAVGSRHSAMSGCRGSALSSTVNFESSALHLALGRHDQRVDLAEHRVELDEGAVELLDDRGDLLLLGRILDAAAVDEPPRDPRLEALERVDVEPDERVGVLLRHLLDLDAALSREHEERLLRTAVEGDREVVLALDVRGLLDPERADDVAVDVEPEDVARLRLGVRGIVGELDAACLAAAAGQYLRLDDDGAAELLGRVARLLGRSREPSVGDRDPDSPEEILALVLVKVHRRRTLTTRRRWTAQFGPLRF